MRQPKKVRVTCKECGKPGTKWAPLPHNHKPIAAPKPTPEPSWTLLYEIFGKK